MAGPAELERLFRQRKLSRRQFVQGLLALGVTAATVDLLVGGSLSQVDPTDAGASTMPYLVLIVLDGFRPEYAGLAPMPNLQALAAGGTQYTRAWVGQMESETPVSHTTLSTGSMPRHDGIIGFEWRDPKTRAEVLDGWPPGVIAGKMQADIKASGAPSIPAVVKAAMPTARVVTLSSEKPYAAQGMGAASADYMLYLAHDPKNHDHLIPAALGARQLPAAFFQHPTLSDTLPMKHFTDWDYLSTTMALAAIDTLHPQVLMINLPGGDVYGHEYGALATPGVFTQIAAGIDRNLGRIVQTYKKAGIFDNTVFVVVADHGMSPNDRSIDGSVTKATVGKAGGQYLFHTGGTCADIYLKNWWHARSVANAMATVPGVAAVYWQADRKGTYEYFPATGQRLDPNLDAAYQYLLGTFRGPTAPDVVAPFRENTIGTKLSYAHGDHGGMNWGSQHVPLILAGPGVRPGVTSAAPARLMDVAPTVLRLLGLPAAAMDGSILADALTDATAQEVATQSALSATLTPLQDALITQAQDNIAEDARLGFKPPPAHAERP